MSKGRWRLSAAFSEAAVSIPQSSAFLSIMNSAGFMHLSSVSSRSRCFLVFLSLKRIFLGFRLGGVPSPSSQHLDSQCIKSSISHIRSHSSFVDLAGPSPNISEVAAAGQVNAVGQF
jgi:hypothetical protein